MRIIFAIVVMSVMLSGCQSYDPERVEEDFGDSVRQMIAEQVYPTDTAVSPSNVGPDRMDGATAVSTVEQYQAAARKAKQSAVSTGLQVQ